jgi:hypothetical protein
MDTSKNTFPSRRVLDGVPRVNFYEGGPRCPEDLCLPSVLRALGEYFGEDAFGCRTCRAIQPGCKINCSYSFFVGVTGVAAFLSWKEGWNDSNAAFYMSADPEAPERWGFRALGYEYHWVERKGGEGSLLESDRLLYRQQVVKSINRGKPVVAYGVVGPPEPAIVTGYDQDGEVLIGWSFFQTIPGFNDGIEYEPDGQFRKRNWFPDTHSMLVIDEKQERLPFNQLFGAALKWAVQVARTPLVCPEPDAPEWYRGRANGLAAYDAWTESLLRDEAYAEADEARLRELHDIHNSAVGQVAEARWYGSQFLLQAADPDILHYSKAEDLMHAAACYAAEHNLMWKVWDLAGGNGNPDAWKVFADPAVRRQMIAVIKEARIKDEQAIEHIERVIGQ